MNQDLLNIIYFSGIFLGLFLLMDLVHLKLQVKASITRKINHTVSGLISLFFPLFFSSHIYVLIICGLFLVLLFVSKQIGLFPSINKVERKTWGSIFFPIVIYYCFVFYEWQDNAIFYILPMSIMTVSDALAEFIGVNLPWKPYSVGKHKKTLSGSIAFLTSSFLITILVGLTFSLSISQTLLIALVISLIGALTEGISTNGLDNLTVPVITSWILFLFLV